MSTRETTNRTWKKRPTRPNAIAAITIMSCSGSPDGRPREFTPVSVDVAASASPVTDALFVARFRGLVRLDVLRVDVRFFGVDVAMCIPHFIERAPIKRPSYPSGERL